MGSVEFENDPKLKFDEIEDIKGAEVLFGDIWKSENPSSTGRERYDFVGAETRYNLFVELHGALEGDKGSCRPDDPDACIGGIAWSDKGVV